MNTCIKQYSILFVMLVVVSHSAYGVAQESASGDSAVLSEEAVTQKPEEAPYGIWLFVSDSIDKIIPLDKRENGIYVPVVNEVLRFVDTVLTGAEEGVGLTQEN